MFGDGTLTTYKYENLVTWKISKIEDEVVAGLIW